MRRLLIAAGLATALATPALADTLQEVTTHGMILILGDMQVPVDFTADGKLTVLGGAASGKWRIDGDKLCTTMDANPTENCVAYPAGKKSGDSFEVTGPQGSATVKIK